ADDFFKAVSTAYGEKPCNLVFTCEGLDFIDSTTLGTFVKLTKMAKADGYTTTLRGLQAKVKKLFLICSLNTIMEID
ncbi:MAG: STAS domain-containing protein, partial [Clostridia bacterium]|nr:STAS domain-containing protein [Clostridia bacterium]